MSIQFEKGINAKELREVIRARIVHEKADAVLFADIIRALKKFQGKKITKRIATHVAKELNTRAFLYQQYGLTYMDVERGETVRVRPPCSRKEIEESKSRYCGDFQDRYMRIYLRGPKNDKGPIVHDIARGLDLEATIESNAWGPLIGECVAKLERGLEEIERFVDVFNQSLEALQTIYKEAEEYGLEYYFDIK